MAQPAAVAAGDPALDNMLRQANAYADRARSSPEAQQAAQSLEQERGAVDRLTSITQRPQPEFPAQQPLPRRPDTTPQPPGWEFILSALPMILLGSRKSAAPL